MSRPRAPAAPLDMQNAKRSVSPKTRRMLLTTLLKGVSRAFYLSLRLLPADLREPIGLAYLLARAADTIADTPLIPPERRLSHLRAFRARLAGESDPAEYANMSAELNAACANPQERALLQALPDSFAMLEALNASDRERTRAVVLTLTRGMEIDLTVFPPAECGKVTALKTREQLDDYIYRIAGCVGEFWTEISMAHTPALGDWDAARMSALGVRFGGALQLTNILRDTPKDLRIGRCYLPSDELERVGLCAADLLDERNAARARPLLAWGIRTALTDFAAAERYIIAIPRRCLRLRLAALLPVIIGLSTLALLARTDRWLNPAAPLKMPRRSVYAALIAALICGRSNLMLTLWIARLRRRVERALCSHA